MYVYVHDFRCMCTHVGVETRSAFRVTSSIASLSFAFVLFSCLLGCFVAWLFRGRGLGYFMLEERSFAEPEHCARLADRSVSFRNLPVSLPPPSSLHWGYGCVLLHLGSLRGFWGFEPTSLTLALRALYQLSHLSSPVFCFLFPLHAWFRAS